MALTTDYDLLAVQYLGSQEAGSRLRNLARAVTQYRDNNPTPGRRNARKAHLAAVAGAAHRLRSALRKIDLSTQLEALSVGLDKQVKEGAPVKAPNATTQGLASAAAEEEEATDTDRTDTQDEAVEKDVTAHSRMALLADLDRLGGLLDTVERGFAALSKDPELAGRSGAPTRHDALQMGLEGLAGLWKQYRPDEPTQSLGKGGFAAFALAMFGAKAVGFDDGTVLGAVVDFLPSSKSCLLMY